MSSLIQTTTPLTATTSFTSSAYQISRASQITGSVYADQAGTVYIEQSGNGTHWDISASYALIAGGTKAIAEALLDQYFRIRYVNGATNQGAFRLFADARDQYGLFLQAPGAPSVGGNYVVLFYPTGSAVPTQVVGRFTAVDGYDANGQGAIFNRVGGKYASFPVANATVTDEVIVQTTLHTPDTF